MEDRLANIIYSEKGYWKGSEAVSKLAEDAKVREDLARKWLEKQAIWQIYLPAPKYVPRPHWVVDKLNYIHQADLLFLPTDEGEKYALVVVDVASRYIDTEPLSSKNSASIAKALKRCMRGRS